VRRSDIEKTELVGAFAIVDSRDLDRISGIAEIEKVDPFHHPAGLNVKAWNDPFGQHRYASGLLNG
jgi:hypothetical protein